MDGKSTSALDEIHYYPLSEETVTAEECFGLYGGEWEKSDISRKFGIECTVDPQMFVEFLRQGLLFGTVGKNEVGELVACYSTIATPYIFNPSILHSQEIVWTLREDYRNLRNLNGFLDEIDKTNKTRGVDMYSIVVPHQYCSPSIMKYMEKRKGLEPMDTVFFKRLT